jgi:hypothetical protein
MDAALVKVEPQESQVLSLVLSGSILRGDEYFLWLNSPDNAPPPSDLSFEEWGSWMRWTWHRKRSLDWKAIYCLAFGERVHGQTYIQIAEDLGVSREYLYNAAGWARAFQNLSLSLGLTVTHARYLANKALDDEERQKFMEIASDNKWTCEQTKIAVKEYLKARSLPEGNSSNSSNSSTIQESETVQHDQGQQANLVTKGGERDDLANVSRLRENPSSECAVPAGHEPSATSGNDKGGGIVEEGDVQGDVVRSAGVADAMRVYGGRPPDTVTTNSTDIDSPAVFDQPDDAPVVIHLTHEQYEAVRGCDSGMCLKSRLHGDRIHWHDGDKAWLCDEHMFEREPSLSTPEPENAVIRDVALVEPHPSVEALVGDDWIRLSKSKFEDFTARTRLLKEGCDMMGGKNGSAHINKLADGTEIFCCEWEEIKAWRRAVYLLDNPEEE